MNSATLCFHGVLVLAIVTVLPRSSVAAEPSTTLATVTVNTLSLVSHPSGPFSILFVTTEGAGPDGANPVARVAGVDLGGGSVVGEPTVVGGAAGDLTTQVLFSSGGFLSLFSQQFSPGQHVTFTVALTRTGANADIPNRFAFYILDGSGTPIPTLSPAVDTLFGLDSSDEPTTDVFASDPQRPTYTGAPISVTAPAVVLDESIDGRMIGIGHIAQGKKHHHFVFRTSDTHAIGEGRLEYWTGDARFCSRDDDEYDHRTGDHEHDYRGRNSKATSHFAAGTIASVIFSDDPDFEPGRRLSRGAAVDSVKFTGQGKWNGRAGYTFEAEATDRGEPGRQRDTFALVVKDPAGQIVAQVSGELDRGNIQSFRVATPSRRLRLLNSSR